MATEKRLIYMEDAKEALIGWETDATDEEIEYTLDHLPKVDAVPRGAYDQVRWERDMAIEQLESYGVSLGEKAEVAKVVHGRWLGTHDGWYYSFSCSECGAEALTKEETMHDQVCSNYCPNCGAKMDGERTKNE